jgi:anti-anti-sigma factor
MADATRFTSRRIQDVLIIELPERAGIGSLELVNELPAALSDPLATDVRHVIVDCANVSFAGSMFLEALVQLHHRLEERDGRLALCGVNKSLGEILDLARFDTLWNRYASVDDALQAVTE